MICDNSIIIIMLGLFSLAKFSNSGNHDTEKMQSFDKLQIPSDVWSTLWFRKIDPAIFQITSTAIGLHQ